MELPHKYMDAVFQDVEIDDKMPDLVDDSGNKIPIHIEQNSNELIYMFKKSTIIDVENLVVLMCDMTNKSKLICLKKLEEHNGDIVLAITALL